MSFRLVYKMLQEVFPQVDTRILKAVAIEFSADADAAVESVITEVLPLLSESSKPSSSSQNLSFSGSTREDESDQQNDLPNCQPTTPEGNTHSLVSESVTDDCANKSSAIAFPATDDCQNLVDGNLNGKSMRFPEMNNEEECSTSLNASNAVFLVNEEDQNKYASSDVPKLLADVDQQPIGGSYFPHGDNCNVLSTDVMHQNGNTCSRLNDSGHSDLEHPAVFVQCEVSQIEEGNNGESFSNGNEIKVKISAARPNPPFNEAMQHASECGLCVKHDSLRDVNRQSATEFVDESISTSIGGSHQNCQAGQLPDGESCRSDGGNCDDACVDALHQDSNTSNDMNYIISDLDVNAVIVQCGTNLIGKENIDESYSSGSKTELNNAAAQPDVTINHVMQHALGSSLICRGDILDNLIEDAKSNKKNLLEEMESIINLMREVELQERAAERAKDEASTGCADILSSAKEMEQMLHRAKEANDMHEGEIYGEKAILSTEARELSTRLLSLSDDRDRSLAILDEMRQTLEERLKAAEEARKVAEQEKLNKETYARSVRAEQEVVMQKLAEESKRLHLEAEENSKLREFLVSRGDLVDTLQGEMHVICQDVRKLKEKLDARVPLSRSVLSKLEPLATSSVKSTCAEASDVTRRLSPSSTTLESSIRSYGGMSNAGERLEDEWEIFDKVFE